MRSYLLYEIANSHGGSREYINKLIDALPHQTNTGIKFQIFKYDEIALKDYPYYKVYIKFFIDKLSWKKIFSKARSRGFDVWIDVFDLYSVEVIKDNLPSITGIKMQSSVLDNLKVLKTLSETVRKSKIKIILNIAGRDLKNIRQTLNDLKTNYFTHNELILQAGFQAYPTDKEDLTIRKIQILKSEFPGMTVSYADHVDGKSPLALKVPVYAILAGAGHIEKHVCLERKKTKYDFQSAIEPSDCLMLIYKITECEKILGNKLIPPKEAEYLKTTIEKPVAAINMAAGDVINFENFEFKRTSQEGLTVNELREYIKKHYVLDREIKSGQIIKKSDLRKARIGVIIACRMKSSRLKEKAILPIKGVASIERCIINAKKIKSADEVILATSTLPEDQILEKYAKSQGIPLFAGDPDDVINRYLGAIEKYHLDIVIRITGDCPTISYEIADLLVNDHLIKGNDYTGAKEVAPGQNSEIYSVNALKKVIKYLGNARHSEYMTWYMINNKDVFRVGFTDLPKELIRNYRITLDYQEDLDMFNALFDKLGAKEPSISNIFRVLDSNPEIPRLNGYLTLRYKTDKKLINMLNKETRIDIRRAGKRHK